ncbi:MAG: GNAT family N-acetyltransferase [Gallionella sp.]|jgi:DNA-binding MarR family transcriptional regulator/ribosomal protein S18 acetylase RimI-like enzyme|nr:GNAT family N-acetyltransferase [Gallionella sp.]
MAADILPDLGPIFLGSRLKRLAERLQAGAARVLADAGLTVQPAHMPLLTALDRGPLTVGQLAEAVGTSQPGVTRAARQLASLGFIESSQGADQRQRTLSLTAAGEAVMARVKLLVWPRLQAAVNEMCNGLSGPLLEQIAVIETALSSRPLNERVAGVMPARLILREYGDDLAATFYEINAEWINSMFQMERSDLEVLKDPQGHILDRGGTILFVEAPRLGIVGTCALRKTGDGSFELTKMGVRASARGLKAGEFLLAATIERATAMHAKTLYLLTNRRCEAAIHLYEKLGFRHDAEIMEKYGSRYARCDVAMRYRGTSDA